MMTFHTQKCHLPGLFSIVVMAMILVSSPPCFGGYEELKNELSGYRPPPYLNPRAEAGRDKTPGAREGRPTERDLSGGEVFKGEKEKAAAMLAGKTSFFRPRAGTVEKLAPAAADTGKAAALLATPFPLETLEILTVTRNRNVKGAEKNVAAEIQAFDQVASLNAVLGQYTAFTEALMNGVGPMQQTGSIKMTYPFPGVVALEGRIVSHSVQAAMAGLAMARRDAVTAARKGYWNLVYVHKAKAIIAETLERFQGLESVANTRYRAGQTSFQDVIKVTIKTKILAEQLRTLGEKEKTIESKLLSLVDLPSALPVARPQRHGTVKQPSRLGTLYRLARENRQELAQIDAEIAKMEAMIEMGETMILPPFSLGFSVYRDRAVQQAGSAAMLPAFAETSVASRGAGLPKRPWFGTNNAWLNQTKQRLAALKEKRKQAETTTDSLVRTAWFELDRARRETVLFQDTIVGLSGSALDVSTRGYESGRVSFADVIGSYTAWLDNRLSLARKKSDMGVALAELSRVVGKTE
ncbi:MAG: TolC family protein [Desulfobacteraceae bacterium]